MSNRYRVSQLLNTWVVRDTELLKKRKRSIVYECKTEEDATAVAALCNNNQPVPVDNSRYVHVANRG